MITLTGLQAASVRMSNQQITGTRFSGPGELVHWMGCVQAQDYPMAKWALGCRLVSATDRSVEAAFNAGDILRTHVLRPTWHFVHPADIRWMLALSAPRIRVLSAPHHKKLGIGQTILRKSRKAILGAFAGQPRLTREALSDVLVRNGIAVEGGRIGLLLMDAELDAIICNVGRIGKKFAYQLVDRVAPAAPAWSREESIAELARRYFTSRGPASIADFAGWAGLTTREAKVGLDLQAPPCRPVQVSGRELWFQPSEPPGDPGTVLLPAFDEFTISYKDRRDVLDPKWARECNSGLGPVVVERGKIVGTWSGRVTGKGSPKTRIALFKPRKATRALQEATKKYSDFGKDDVA